MHLSEDLVDRRLLRRDAGPQFRISHSAFRSLRPSSVAIPPRLERGGELLEPDRPADEPDQPGERITLFRRGDVDAQGRAMQVDGLEDLRHSPATLEQSKPCDRVADLTDVSSTDPLQIRSAVRCLHGDAVWR